jgi:glycosyltransferase involved in cell wall biosynthesis
MNTQAPSTRRQTVAAVIPTKNVADFVRGTLESLWFCDEIIIVDMNSTDGTREVCESYPNVRFFTREDYIYGNFNFGVEQATSDWIIRLDSDERLSIELQDEIVALLQQRPDCDVYEAPFTSYIDGNPIRHGMAWEQPVRKTLFRRGALRYAVRSEHEDLTSPNEKKLTVGRLRGRYHHFSTPDISTFWRKIDYYTEKDHERATPSTLRVTPVWKLLLAVPRDFCKQYFWQRGYRDGYAGFVLCAMNQMYRLLHEMKSWETRFDMKANHIRVRDAFDRKIAENRRLRCPLDSH